MATEKQIDDFRKDLLQIQVIVREFFDECKLHIPEKRHSPPVEIDDLIPFDIFNEFLNEDRIGLSQCIFDC